VGTNKNYFFDNKKHIGEIVGNQIKKTHHDINLKHLTGFQNLSGVLSFKLQLFYFIFAQTFD